MRAGSAIRRAEIRDAADLAQVHVRSWQVAYRGQLPDDFLDQLDDDVPRRTSQWERSIESAPERRWTQLVAEDAGRVVGFIGFGPARDEPDRTGEVYAIYVQPDAWGRGFGRSLMTAAVQGLAREGYSEAVLWVLGSNARSRRFYEIAGWTADGGAKTETMSLPFGAVELREVRYRRSLP